MFYHPVATSLKKILLNNPHQHPLLYLSGINAAQMLKIEGLMEKENDDKVETDTVDQVKSKKKKEADKKLKKKMKKLIEVVMH